MAKSDLWQKLNSEVSLASVKALITGQPARPEKDHLDAQAEEIMSFAEREARLRGKRVEEVLAELGFSLPSGHALAPQRTTKSAPVAAPPEALAPAPPAAPAPTVIDPLQAAAQALVQQLPPLSRADLQPLLDGLDATAVHRLALLYPEYDTQALDALLAADARPLWQRLLGAGVSAAALADVLRLQPGGPALPSAALPAATGLQKRPAKALLEDFPAAWVRLFHLVPLRRSSTTVVVAASYAPPPRLLQRLSEELGRKVQLQLASEAELAPLRVVVEGLLKPAAPLAAEPAPRPPIAPPAPAAPAPAPAPGGYRPPASLPPVPAAPAAALAPDFRYSSAVEGVEQLLRLALRARATDIHIEPAERGARVRFRIDGICHEVTRLEPDSYMEMVARVKILADLDVTERRRPQDGHIRTAIEGNEHDLRVATVPARGGEKVGIRIANTGPIQMRLEQLGLDQADLDIIRDTASMPFGMLLATGPVGSGKTTTLYSCLNEVDRTHRHVMSIEDPVEFTLEGANHIEVNYALGFDFVQGLRALLRQDPDTILIGEIRDEETARIAIRASMTGLMVYSTLHANDATGALTTLRNFHIPPHLLASAIRGVVAQRLVRRICPQCKAPQALRPEDAHSLGMSELPAGLRAFRGAGCAACLHTGYIGRIGVFEIFHVDDAVRAMILEEASERDIRAYAMSRGMRTLQQDGLRKIAEGVTTIEEFHRVLRF